jgi:Fic family protein
LHIFGSSAFIRPTTATAASRAIADMVLAGSENSPQRFYSMSAQIRQECNAYYDILERTQKGTMDITPWMDWFSAASAVP